MLRLRSVVQAAHQRRGAAHRGERCDVEKHDIAESSGEMAGAAGLLRGRAVIALSEGEAVIQASPPMSVSVSGKRDFAKQRQRRRKGASHSTHRQQRQSAHTKTPQFGAIGTTPGNLCLHETAWWGWEDSNFQPNDYQLLALRKGAALRVGGPMEQRQSTQSSVTSVVTYE
jgi:hypothetical protein